VPADFNIRPFTWSRSEGRVSTKYPTLTLMTSTKVELSFNKIAKLKDLADLAELLFLGNRNHQHAFLAVWISLKWSDHHMVPNLGEVARQHSVSRRTLERVRAKMRRMGLIDHVSRFSACHGYREGWVQSNRFERSLRELADRAAGLKDAAIGCRDKDMMHLEFADARRHATRRQSADQAHGGGEAHV
jgi:hypothetical protein